MFPFLSHFAEDCIFWKRQYFWSSVLFQNLAGTTPEEVKMMFPPSKLRELWGLQWQAGLSEVMTYDCWVWVSEAKRPFRGSLSLRSPALGTQPLCLQDHQATWGSHMKAGVAADVSAKSQSPARCARRAPRWFQPAGFKSPSWGPSHCRDKPPPAQGLSKFLIPQIWEHNVFCYNVFVACYRATDNQDAHVHKLNQQVHQGYLALSVGHPSAPTRSLFSWLLFGRGLFYGGEVYPQHMEVPRLGVKSEPQPQQHRIRAASVTYTTAYGNIGSLTHWARPGIKLSWIRFCWATGERTPLSFLNNLSLSPSTSFLPLGKLY